MTGKSLPAARAGETTERDLKFHGMPAGFEKNSISLVLFGTNGLFKRWNSPNVQKKCFIKVFTMRRQRSFNF